MGRFILCGKGDAAASALELLVGGGHVVRAIATHGDSGTDGWQRSLAGAADAHAVEVERPRSINDPAVAASLREFAADALLSIQYDQILRGEFFETVGCPCINFHFALLPRHRGVAPVAWAILCGDREAGVTAHEMVESIDAGAVLAQQRVAIGGETTARELFDALTHACVDLFGALHPFGPDAMSRRIEQDASLASYHRAGDFDFSRRDTDFSSDATRLHAWLRAMIFPPFQHPEIEWRGRRLRIERVAAEIGDARGAAPGTVLAADAGGVEVAATGGSIRITALAEAGDASVTTASALDRPVVGERFGA